MMSNSNITKNILDDVLVLLVVVVVVVVVVDGIANDCIVIFFSTQYSDS